MKRPRMLVKMWLDLGTPDQQWLADTVIDLRKRRQFARTLREGIALVVTLRQGDFSVLDELFPGVRQTSAMPSQEFHELIRAVHELKAQQSRAGTEALPGKLPVPTLAVASSAKSNSETVAKNFLSSVKGFASGFFD
jgi:hypothetical protein